MLLAYAGHEKEKYSTAQDTRMYKTFTQKLKFFEPNALLTRVNITGRECFLAAKQSLQMTESNTTTKPYIVKSTDGVEYLHLYYPATLHALLDDEDTIRELLNSILELDHEHKNIDFSNAFEKVYRRVHTRR